MQLGNRSGKLYSGRAEYQKSTYNRILMTTNEGRIASGSKERIIEESYDAVFTAKTPLELRCEISESKIYNDFYNQIRILDPEFYEKLQGLNLYKDEDANIIIDYLTSKVNNPVSKENLLEAIINVKKTIYKNFNEQDFEDMRMGYSIRKPFKINNLPLYEEYIERRYNDVKKNTLEEAKERNCCLDVDNIMQYMKRKALKDKYGFLKSFSHPTISDKQYIDLFKQNRKKVEDIGFKVEILEADEIYEEAVELIFPEEDNSLPIEEQINFLKNKKKQLYIALGLEKEKSQTQILGQQTLEQQNDTVGKSNVQNELSRQLENEKMQNAPIID